MSGRPPRPPKPVAAKPNTPPSDGAKPAEPPATASPAESA